MPFLFENLDFYRKAMELAEEVLSLTAAFPPTAQFLAEPLNRAVVTVPTLLADGSGRASKLERKELYAQARGAAQQCVTLADLARRKGLIDAACNSSLRNKIEALIKLISAQIITLGAREG